VHPLAARRHGGYRELEIAPLADAYLDELMEELPVASERVLRIQARRLARLELLGRFEDRNGVLRNKRRGEPFAATLLAEKISSAFIRTHAELEAQSGHVDPNGGLAAITRELTSNGSEADQ
jgi:hypothetical protein